MVCSGTVSAPTDQTRCRSTHLQRNEHRQEAIVDRFRHVVTTRGVPDTWDHVPHLPSGLDNQYEEDVARHDPGYHEDRKRQIAEQ